MINILLIENQQTQFLKIFDLFQNSDLKDEYIIYPIEDDYINFIDYVRVWVNIKYDIRQDNENNEEMTYRDLAMSKIIKTITDNKIDIILIDYKLGAGYLSHTGIDLADAINKIIKKNTNLTLPVIFISKDQKNKEIEKKLLKYEFSNTWIYKGFFGDEILQEDYIKEYVINGKGGIKQILNAKKHEDIESDLDGGID